MGGINWGQVATIGLGITLAVILIGLAGRIAR